MGTPGTPPPLRLALIGAGTFASSAHHTALTALRSANRVHITLVWSRTESSASDLAATYASAIPVYHQLASHPTALVSASHALDQHAAELDAAVIALPPGPQERFAAMALSKRLHVIMEKPLALHLHGARKLLAAAATLPDAKVLALAENFRFEAALYRARFLVENECGRVVAARLTVKSPMKEGSRYGVGWRLQMDGPGVLLDGCVHHIAALRVVFGSDVVRVNAHCSRQAGWFKGTDTITGYLVMGNDVNVTTFVTYASDTFAWELEVVGTEGDVVVERLPGKPGYRVSTVLAGQSRAEADATEIPFNGIDGEFEAFLESCAKGTVHSQLDASKGFNDMAAVFAMFESSKTKAEVQVETVDVS